MIPSTAPSKVNPLISSIVITTYGKVAVKYTTCKTSKILSLGKCIVMVVWSYFDMMLVLLNNWPFSVVPGCDVNYYL